MSSLLTDSFSHSLLSTLKSIDQKHLEILQEKDAKIKELESKIDRLQQYDLIDDILDEVERKENEPNKYTDKYEHKGDYKQMDEEHTEDDDTDDDEDESRKKTTEFWRYLETKLKERDIEWIKDLVRKKDLNMEDTNGEGRNLLMLATANGSYELVSMCINLGADIDKEDNKKQTALKIAKQNGFPDIEELLIMNLLKTELGQRIENTTNDLLQKQGITNNFSRILNDIFTNKNGNEYDEKKDEKYDDENDDSKPITNTFLNIIASAYKDELLETMLKITLRSIKEKTAYSNDILHIAFSYEVNRKKRNPTDTILYKTIKQVVVAILNDTKNKKNWFWLKNYILASSIWYFKINPKDKNSKYLWYNIFDWVENEVKTQSTILSKPMRTIENKNVSEWNKLISYNIKTNYKYENVRQDVITNGLKAEYTKEHLTQNVSISSTFNPLTHYDLSQYLTKLILICHEIDDQFHSDMEKIFDVNKETKENKKLGVVYMRGPVKHLSRCYAKCQSDYRDERFPTASHVLDIVRCSLIFEDVSSMLFGMDHLHQKIKEKTFCILEVVRVKNGFIEYSHDNASYCDIKFNVMIKGKKYNVIGEVQFLFRKMADYKKIAHSLYSIERRQLFVDDLSEVLPVKLDLEKQLFIHAARNNINGLTDLMVTHNYSENDLLQLNLSKQSILTTICSTNCEKVFNFLIKSIPKDAIKERLMRPEQSKSYPLGRAIGNNHFNGVLRTIFENDKFDLINCKDHEQKTPLTRCFASNKGKCSLLILKNIKSTQQLMTVLEDTTTGITALQYGLQSGDLECVQFIFDQLEYNEKLKIKLMTFRDSTSKSNWHYAAKGGNIECIKLLLSKCENDKQRNELWEQDDNLESPLFDAVKNGKSECVEFLLGQINDTSRRKFFNTVSKTSRCDPIRFLAVKTQKNHVETLKIAISHMDKDDLRLYEVFLFAARNDFVEIARLLVNTKNSNEFMKMKMINYQSTQSECAMHICAQENNLQFLEWLLTECECENTQFTFRNRSGKNPLMIAAYKGHIKCCKMILNKLNRNAKIKSKVLTTRDNSDCDSVQLAVMNSGKNNKKCARVIMKYYDENDIESTFLPSVQLEDLKLATNIWNKTKDNPELQKKLLTTTDQNKNNCFFLVCKNGAYKSLQWLLTLNDESKEEAKEDEENLTQKHVSNGKSPLLMCVEQDDRRESKNKQKKSLTDDEKDNYFKCAKLIFEKVQNKHVLVFEADTTGKNALMYACLNANIQIATYILSKINDKNKKLLIDRKDTAHNNCFHHAINGGSFELVEMMYNLYFKYEKNKQITNDSRVLQLALQSGHVDITKYILFTLIKNSKTKLKFLNTMINSAKTTRKYTETLRIWITKILTKEIKHIDEAQNIADLFNWVLKNSPSNDLSIITLMLSKLSKDDYFKDLFIKKSSCISFCCKNNRIVVLHKLLKYLDHYTNPLIESNAFMESIDARNDKCIDIILKFIKKKDTKDQLIETRTTTNENALMKCIQNKSPKILQLLVSNHSNIEKLLGEAFLFCLKNSQADTAKYLLSKSHNRTSVLNYKSDINETALMYALFHVKADCLQFIIDELKQDVDNTSEQVSENTEEKKHDDNDEEKSNNIHPMYFTENDNQSNIFHVMFAKTCSIKSIEILESVLSKDIICKLLSSRNIDDELPIDVAWLKNEIEIIEWILNQFEDPLEKIDMIAKRNIFERTLLHKTSDNKSRMVEDTKPFLAKQIFHILEQTNLNNLDICLLKDTFQYTISWQYPPLQQLILSAIPHKQYKQLLNRDNMLFSGGKSCVHQVLHGNEKMCEIILSAITNNKQLMSHTKKGKTFLHYAVDQRVGHQNSRLLLEKFVNKNKVLFDFISEETNISNYQAYGAISQAYIKGDKQYQDLILEYLSDDQKYVAILAAVYRDSKFTHIPSIISSLSESKENESKESESVKNTQYNLIRSQDGEGQTILFIATNYNYSKIIDWIFEEIKENDDPILTTYEYYYNQTPLTTLVLCNMPYYAEKCLNHMNPETILKILLTKEFNWSGQGILGLAVGKIDIEMLLSKTLMSLFETDDIVNHILNDIEIMFYIFHFLVKSKTANKNIKTLEIILSKVPKSIKMKLFNGYCNSAKTTGEPMYWNALRETAKTDKKEMFEYLLKIACAQPEIISMLNDEYNPYIEKKQSVLQSCCINADMDCVTLVTSAYDEHKENSDEQVTKCDYNNKRALFYAVCNNKIDIVTYILKRIKNDSERMSIFNQETKDTHKNIFDAAKTAQCKDKIKTSVISVLRNIKVNKINSSSFVSYFHYLCAENDIDSIKQLENIFNKEKNYIGKLLKSVNSTNKQSPLHIACANNNSEIIEYFLSFIRNEKDKEELLSIQDNNGNTCLMILFENSFTRCASLILNKLKSNKRMLSQIILTTNFSNETCIHKEINKNKIVCCKLLLDYNYNIDATIIPILFISIIKKTAIQDDEFINKLMKLYNTRKLFAYQDDDGCNVLYHLLFCGNTKFVKVILDNIDKSDDKAIADLVNYRNFKGKSLMHAACASGNIYCAKSIVNMCEFFQNLKTKLLLSTDNAGNNPLHTYLENANGYKPAKRLKFIMFYLSNIKKHHDKLSLISCSNLIGQIPLDCASIKDFEFGGKLFEMILSQIKCNADHNNMESFVKLLHLTIECKAPNSLKLIKSIMNKYHNEKDKIKLIFTQNHQSQNAINIVMKKNINYKILYLLSFINQNNTNLLIENFDLNGNILLHDIINTKPKISLKILQNVESIKDILLIKNDTNKSVINKCLRSPMNLICLKQLNEDDKVKMFIENLASDDGSLFNYFEDHSQEFMKKLLWSTSSSTKNTLLMYIVQHCRDKKYLINWIIPHIKSLNNADRLRLLNTKNILGENCLHSAARVSHTQVTKLILSLFPTPEDKEKALLEISNIGKTPWMIAWEGTRMQVGKQMWNNISKMETKLQLFNKSYDITPIAKGNKFLSFFNYVDWIKNSLRNMKKKYIDNVELLIPSFRLAAFKNDIEFAKLIVSKINVKDPDKIIQFVTYKIPAVDDECCLHFAAYSKYAEIMEILFNLMENNMNDYDLNKLLLNKSIINNGLNETPITIAAKKNNPRVIKYLLSKIKDTNDKLKLIGMESIYELEKTNNNYKNKNDYQISINSLLMCCMKCNDCEALKQLLLYYDKNSMNKIIKYTNNKNQNIYHFVRNIEQCEFLQNNCKISFEFNTFNNSIDNEGMTPFMCAIKQKCNVQFIEWILNECCKNNDEQLQLIYNSNIIGENSLDLSMDNNKIQFLLMKQIKNIISSYKKINNIKDFIQILIPIFLWSLKTGKINLSKWLLLKLHKDNDKKKLINCSNKVGLNSLLSALSGGEMLSLQFLLTHALFDKNILFKKDINDLTAIHYCCIGKSISCLHKILLLYKELNPKKHDLMYLKDKSGNIPFDYIFRKGNMTNYATMINWILKNCFDDNIEQKMKMIFNMNNKGEIAILERYIDKRNEESIVKCIRKYFENIGKENMNDQNIEFAACSLLYLGRYRWILLKLILSKIKYGNNSEKKIFKLLNFKNSDGYTILHYVHKTATSTDGAETIHIIDWYLTEIIPNNHPILTCADNISKKTILMLLIKRGFISLAEKLLNKIDDKKEKLRLIQMKDSNNKTILDHASDANIPNIVKWIENQIKKTN